jgi:hypothetical protein
MAMSPDRVGWAVPVGRRDTLAADASLWTGPRMEARLPAVLRVRTG